MRVQLPRHLQSHLNCKKDDKSVVNNNDVQFVWSMLSEDIDEAIAGELLEEIVELWVTIRGSQLCQHGWSNTRQALGQPFEG